MSESKYIGISEHRLDHTIAVARKCYDLAKNEYDMSEMDARKMFLMGFLHDMGYEFSENTEEHPGIVSDILNSLSEQDFPEVKAEHGSSRFASRHPRHIFRRLW